MKRLVKLINNERTNTKLLSPKACDAISTDTCVYIDKGICTVHSYDLCNKDYVGCSQHSMDDCTFYFSDYNACKNFQDDYGN